MAATRTAPKARPVFPFHVPFQHSEGMQSKHLSRGRQAHRNKSTSIRTLSYFYLGAARLTRPAAVTEAGRAQRGHRAKPHIQALHIALAIRALRLLGQGVPPRLMLLTYFSAQHNEIPDSQNHRTNSVGKALRPPSPAQVRARSGTLRAPRSAPAAERRLLVGTRLRGRGPGPAGRTGRLSRRSRLSLPASPCGPRAGLPAGLCRRGPGTRHVTPRAGRRRATPPTLPAAKTIPGRALPAGRRSLARLSPA